MSRPPLSPMPRLIPCKSTGTKLRATVLSGHSSLALTARALMMRRLTPYAILERRLVSPIKIQDDLLGVFGDEAVTGKSTLTDLREGEVHAARASSPVSNEQRNASEV